MKTSRIAEEFVRGDESGTAYSQLCTYFESASIAPALVSCSGAKVSTMTEHSLVSL